MDPKNTDFQEMMKNFMQNAQKMQENLQKAYQELAEKNKDKTVAGKAGGDLVTAHVSLKLQLSRLELKPELFEEKPEVIAELITAAVNQGLFEAQQTVKKEMMEITQKMGMPSNLPPFGDKG